jgi:hypothetical protein
MGLMFACAGCGGGGGGKTSITVPPPQGVTQTPFVIAIEVQPSAPSLIAGATQSFTATAIFTDGTTQDVTSSATWTSNAGSIISMSGATATAGAVPGTTYITATSGSVSGHTIVSVGTIPSGGAATYYVSTTGNDSNSGTSLSAAFLTLDRARQAVAGKAGSAVEIEDGIYYLPATISFAAADSGSATSPIIYRAAAGAHPVISGGARIAVWTPPTSGSAWTASLASASSCPVAVPGTFCNFEGLYYQTAAVGPDMERRFRPRTTLNTACTVYPCSSYLYNSSNNPVIQTASTANCSLQVSTGFECFDQFLFNGSDIAPTYHDIGLGDVEVLDFEKWTMSRLRLLSVSGNTATLTSPTFQGQDYGFFPGHRYLIENCDPNVGGDPTCQQQVPGQWYLDRCPNTTLTCTAPNGQATWTLTYFAQTGENPNTDTVIVPQQLQLISGNGTSNLVFEGLTFSNDNWLPGNPPLQGGVSCNGPCGLGDTSGSPNVSAAVSFTNAHGVIFNACTFSHTQGWGIAFEGNSSGNEVVNSTLYDTGDGGIRIGAYPSPSDSDPTIPQYNLVENNILDALGRVQPSGIGTGVWIGNAHHNVIAHNEIQDLYNGAVALGLGFGGTTDPILGHDNILSFNQLFNLGQGVTSDMGGVHSGALGVQRNMILNNVIHDVNHNYLDPDGYGGNGLYFDNSTSQSVAHNNLVYRLTGFGVFNNLAGGTNSVSVLNNVVLNNIIALPHKDVIQRGGDIPYSLAFVQNVVYYDFGGSVINGHWNCPDQTCTNQFLLDHNDYWNTSGSAPQFITTTSGGASTVSLSAWQALGEDVDSIVQNPLFTDPNNTNDPPTDGFALQSSSPAFASPVSFENFDATQAGVFSTGQATFQAPSVPPTLACASASYLGACPAFPLELFTDY